MAGWRSSLAGSRLVIVTHKGQTIEFDGVPFTGWYSYDAGVRYLPDGSGEPPLSDGNVVSDWTEADVRTALTEWYGNVEVTVPDWVIADAPAILQAINEKLCEEVFEDPDIDQYIPEAPED